ncbi:MAG TPA: vWA domain-containing protein [Polyangiaceae bacterium]|nr:vWA domain-containing protein [Polyangiaceae bacterium]
MAVACGDGQPESHVEGGAASSSGGSNGAGNGNGTAGLLDLGGSMSGSGGGNGTAGSGVGGGCAAVNEQAALSPVYLVFLLDESGSMGDGANGIRAEKWDPVTAALRSFFADPSSTGITASLSVFPLNQNMGQGAASSSMPAACTADAYVDPMVMPRPLPDDKAFADAIAALDPPNEYGTPTRPALQGTIQYAESLLAEDATRKVAIVMVTDGEPFSCQGNNIQNTASAAMAVADRIPTYVIGVGDSLTALDNIAKGGGTESAFIVSLDNPEQTRTDLLDAINLIRGRSISCELEIPAPPAGRKLDPKKVNVQFTPDGQPGVNLKYGTECSGDTAWRYDDAATPTTIQLCDSACAMVKADPAGKLDVVFECATRDVVN